MWKVANLLFLENPWQNCVTLVEVLASQFGASHSLFGIKNCTKPPPNGQGRHPI